MSPPKVLVRDFLSLQLHGDSSGTIARQSEWPMDIGCPTCCCVRTVERAFPSFHRLPGGVQSSWLKPGISAKIILSRFDGRMAFVPERQPDVPRRLRAMATISLSLREKAFSHPVGFHYLGFERKRISRLILSSYSRLHRSRRKQSTITPLPPTTSQTRSSGADSGRK